MKIEAHILACDEEEIFIYAARYYTSFCSKVVLHDLGSSDGTMDIAAQFGIEVRQWDSGGKVDDRVNMRVKNECWAGTDSDWVIVADADEFIYFPHGALKSLTSYSQQQIPIVKTRGWEMTSPTMPTTPGHIFEQIKYGARDDKWYGKPVLFTPKLVKLVNFSPGAHQVQGVLIDGLTLIGNPIEFPQPETYLLHFHQIGSVDRVGAKYDRTRAKMCDANVKMGWGNFEPGLKHAIDKRNFILSRLERVIP
jgi:hypothetical protein